MAEEFEEFRKQAMSAAWVDVGRFADRLNRPDTVIRREWVAMMFLVRGLFLACPMRLEGVERAHFMREKIANLGMAFTAIEFMKYFGFEPEQFNEFILLLEELDKTWQ